MRDTGEFWKAAPLLFIVIFYSWILTAGLLPAGLGVQGFTAVMIFLATVYLWATEMIPLPVTAFLSVMLLAVSGSVGLPDALYGFGSSVVFIIITGFFLSAGLMKSGLDRRIAFAILRKSRSENSVFIGLIIITAFLSMIISNTTTTLLMVPIAIHIMHRVRMNKECLLLGIAYAANIGGAGLLVGTPPNMIAVEALGWGFFEWMVAALPFTLMMLVMLYVSFVIYFRPKHVRIRSHLVEDLGPVSKEEKVTASIIILTILLWLTSPIHNIPAVAVGLFAGILMLLFVYGWKYFEKRTHWGTIFLIAGAVSLGHSLEVTGAAGWMADSFLAITGFTSPVLIAFSFVLFSLAITQFIQNTATAAMMTPVLIGLSGPLGIPATVMVVPVILGVSMTFLMPPGTAPNAIVHGVGKVKTREMIKAGALPTVFAVILMFTYIVLMV